LLPSKGMKEGKEGEKKKKGAVRFFSPLPGVKKGKREKKGGSGWHPGRKKRRKLGRPHIACLKRGKERGRETPHPQKKKKTKKKGRKKGKEGSVLLFSS